MSLFPVTIEEQIACVEREIGFRSRVYPRWIKQNKLSQNAADQEMLRMKAVKETLEEVRKGISARVPGVEEIRAGERARVLGLLAPMVHSSVMARLDSKVNRDVRVNLR